MTARRPRPLAIGILVAGLAALLASCAAGQGRVSRAELARIDRVLENAPFKAQPSRIVATEAAFEQAAVADGQWTAFRSFAAPGALIHVEEGATDAGQWLEGRSDPVSSVRWDARAVWVSCDARLAVSRGRLRTPEGQVGTYVTVWQLQDDREYRWIYDTGALDDPQPPAPPADETPSEDLIVVGALDSVQGHVAACPASGQPPIPPAPVPAYAQDTRTGAFVSPDGTLQVRWVHRPSGERSVVLHHWQDDGWVQGMDQPIPGAITGR